MAIDINNGDIFLCDFCGIVIKTKQCPQIILPKQDDAGLILKFDNWACLSAWVVKKIMDDEYGKAKAYC
jgi:hypothetical protein